ncbi:MAG: Maf family nucleotide pyrophosphatase [Patescibacteria group bacterium]
MNKIILASQSPQRKLMMDTLGIDYEIVPSNLDESKIKELDPRKKVVELARLKAKDISRKNPKATIIAADTFGLLKHEVLEKPKDKKEAVKMLRKISGQWIVALTGVSLQNQKSEIKNSALFETMAKFRKLSDKEIQYYVDTQPVTTWSAAFCPGYPAGAALIEKTDGDLTSFLYGLPVSWVVGQLKKTGKQL